MVNSDDPAAILRGLIDSHLEWLLVRESGRSFPLRRTEIEIESRCEQVLFGVFDDSGFDVRCIDAVDLDENEIVLTVSYRPEARPETLRLIPRTPARRLAENIELARLVRANQIGNALIDLFPSYKLTRIALRLDNGRIAEVFARDAFGREIALMADVTATMIHEMILTTAVIWQEKLTRRKKPITQVWIAAERKQARGLQKLLALFNPGAAARFSIFEIVTEAETLRLKGMKRIAPSGFWREKRKKMSLPDSIRPSATAEAIMQLAPDRTDLIFSKQGETIRYHGLPFARVRTMAGRESAWFGFDRDRRPLVDRNWGDLVDLVERLGVYRDHATPNKRHEFYRAAPEAWLESILRRNIQVLDANLILSPIYNQFRASSDKIDLLAIRRDGRLVIIELKTSPDREMVFQAADYWRMIEHERRRGELARVRAFGDMEILDKPALVYAVAPALSFHRDFGVFAQTLRREIEIWRFELREDWRDEINVISRRDYPPSPTNL